MLERAASLSLEEVSSVQLHTSSTTTATCPERMMYMQGAIEPRWQIHSDAG